MTEPRFTFKRPEDFFTSPTECLAIEDVKRELRETQSSHPDDGQMREQEDWSFLANRVVGAEGD